MNEHITDLYFKAGGELADNVTDQQIDFIHRMSEEWKRQGFDDDSARQLAVRIGMKIILGQR